jgi:hypothetical protein
MIPIDINLHAKFKEGDWVFGLGKNEGCSQVFLQPPSPDKKGCDQLQPFMYLGDMDPANFRLATDEEIIEAKELMGIHNPLAHNQRGG